MKQSENKIKDPFNRDFCSVLEYHLCKTFKNSADEEIKKLWCDGINHEALNKSQKSVNDTRKIITNAWIGKDGQGEYEMILHFGKESLSRFAISLDLIHCIPSEETDDWITIDIENKKIELRLK